MDEGYIKFNCDWNNTEIGLSEELIAEMNECRSLLMAHGLIGIYDNAVGYGNMSIRSDSPFFFITGTATGSVNKLTAGHISKVTSYNLTKNQIACSGLIKASSESLTHAVIYECAAEANAVIHVHSELMWTNLLHKVPTTNEAIPYGTPEMAIEVKRLFKETEVRKKKILAMGGHREGIISFGTTLEEAYRVIMNYFT